MSEKKFTTIRVSDEARKALAIKKVETGEKTVADVLDKELGLKQTDTTVEDRADDEK